MKPAIGPESQSMRKLMARFQAMEDRINDTAEAGTVSDYLNAGNPRGKRTAPGKVQAATRMKPSAAARRTQQAYAVSWKVPSKQLQSRRSRNGPN